jgi:alkylation response protein AidB-like acyl-CoA dehydrogenase
MSFLAYPATDQQKELVEMAGELADTFAQRVADYDWEGRFPQENYADLRSSGYLTLTVPRLFGGYGASLLDVVLAQTRLGQGCASTALAASMHLINIPVILMAWMSIMSFLPGYARMLSRMEP